MAELLNSSEGKSSPTTLSTPRRTTSTALFRGVTFLLVSIDSAERRRTRGRAVIRCHANPGDALGLPIRERGSHPEIIDDH